MSIRSFDKLRAVNKLKKNGVLGFGLKGLKVTGCYTLTQLIEPTLVGAIVEATPTTIESRVGEIHFGAKGMSEISCFSFTLNGRLASLPD